MRARDVRAITFWLASSLSLFGVIYLVTRGIIAASAATAAYNAWLLTRPRMRRVFARLRGETLEFHGYYID